MPQPAASGQRGKAAQAVRKRTAKCRGTDPKTNSFVFGLSPRLFLCPEALFTFIKLQAQFVCCFSQAGSPGGMQGRKPLPQDHKGRGGPYRILMSQRMLAAFLRLRICCDNARESRAGQESH